MNGIMKYINRISRCNGVVYANRLRGYGITQCQHPYILLICREPGIPQEKISREIMRKQDPTDRRVWRVYPTQKMQELLPHVRLVMKEWNEYLLEEFSEEEQEKLVVALEKLMQRAQTAAQESLKGR